MAFKATSEFQTFRHVVEHNVDSLVRPAQSPERFLSSSALLAFACFSKVFLDLFGRWFGFSFDLQTFLFFAHHVLFDCAGSSLTKCATWKELLG